MSKEWKRINQKYHIPEVEEKWAIQFTGFFYGDGSIGIYRRKNSRAKHRFLYSPTLSISARMDNEPLILEIKRVLGGKLQYLKQRTQKQSGYTIRPTVRWYLYGWANARGVIEATNLCNGILPAKKASEIQLAYECILKRFEMPFRLRPEDVETIHSYYIRCKELKNF